MLPLEWRATSQSWAHQKALGSERKEAPMEGGVMRVQALAATHVGGRDAGPQGAHGKDLLRVDGLERGAGGGNFSVAYAWPAP